MKDEHVDTISLENGRTVDLATAWAGGQLLCAIGISERPGVPGSGAVSTFLTREELANFRDAANLALRKMRDEFATRRRYD